MCGCAPKFEFEERVFCGFSGWQQQCLPCRKHWHILVSLVSAMHEAVALIHTLIPLLLSLLYNTFLCYLFTVLCVYLSCLRCTKHWHLFILLFPLLSAIYHNPYVVFIHILMCLSFYFLKPRCRRYNHHRHCQRRRHEAAADPRQWQRHSCLWAKE